MIKSIDVNAQQQEQQKLKQLKNTTLMQSDTASIVSVAGISRQKNISIKLLKAFFPQFDAKTDEFITQITNVKELDLKNQNLTHIDGLDMLTSVESVCLADNQIVDIDPLILQLLPNLKLLNLYNNCLTELPNIHDTSIQSLNIAYNNLKSINVEYLPRNLKAISISGTGCSTEAIKSKYPDIEIIESGKPETKSIANEVTQVIKQMESVNIEQYQKDIKQVEEALKTDKERIQERNQSALNKLQKPKSAKPPLQTVKKEAGRKTESQTPKILKSLKSEKKEPEKEVVLDEKLQIMMTLEEQLQQKYKQLYDIVDGFDLDTDQLDRDVTDAIANSKKRMFDDSDWRSIIANDKVNIDLIQKHYKQAEQLIGMPLPQYEDLDDVD